MDRLPPILAIPKIAPLGQREEHEGQEGRGDPPPPEPEQDIDDAVSDRVAVLRRVYDVSGEDDESPEHESVPEVSLQLARSALEERPGAARVAQGAGVDRNNIFKIL